MTTPFSTQRSRRAGLFIGFWAVCIASIIVDSTVEAAGTAEAVALSLGRFYTAAHRTLLAFAESATVPTSVPLFLYLVLAGVTVLLSLYILEMYTFGDTHYHFIETYLGVLLYTMFGIAMLLFLVGNTIWVVTGGIELRVVVAPAQFVLGMSPQALVFALYLLVISFVTAYIP